MVEFALALPVFLFLVFATIEGSFAVVTFISIQNAAREGARYATISPADTNGIVTAAKHTAIVLRGGALNVTSQFPNGQSSGQPVDITVEYQYRPVVGLLPAIPMKASSEMVIE